MGITREEDVKHHLRLMAAPPAASAPKFKEKVVLYYEQLFAAPGPNKKDPPFEEMFLLEPSSSWLHDYFAAQTPETLLQTKAVIAKIVVRSIGTLNEKHGHFRRQHAAETLTLVLAGVFSKPFNNFAFDSLAVLLSGLADADVLFPSLVTELLGMLQKGEPSLKLAALNLLLTILAGNQNLNQQPLTEYFFAKNNLFASLINIIASPDTDFAISLRAVLALGLLANFRKGEIKNLYAEGLTATIQGTVFERMLQVFRTACHRSSDDLSGVSHGTNIKANYSANTIIRTFSTMWSDFFRSTGSSPATTNGTGDHVPVEDVSVYQSALLTFYELASSNPRFMTALVQEAEKAARGLTPTQSAADVGNAGPQDKAPGHGPTLAKGSTFVEFLVYASTVFQFNATKREMAYSRLCLILISVFLENTEAIALFYDVNSKFAVDVCRSKPPMVPKPRGPVPIAQSLMDVICVAINHSLRVKSFPVDLYLLALSCVHRCLAHQKRYRIRLAYDFNTIWLSLSRLLSFLGANVEELREKPKFGALVVQIVSILNFVLQYGDLFLPDTLATEQLLYEIIRNRDSLVSLKKLWTEGQGPDFRNIDKTIACFFPLLPSSTAAPTTTEEILALIRKHYDSGALVLVNVPNLDSVARYTETTENSFFRALIRLICADVKKMADVPEHKAQLKTLPK